MEQAVKKEHKYRALGIDPGLAATGYAVVGTFAQGGELCTYGSLKTAAKTLIPERLQMIYRGVSGLLQEWRPDIMIVEDVYVLDRYPKAAVQLGEVRGVIALAAQDNGVEVVEMKPTEVKGGLTGNGRASKEQVSRAVKRMLGVKKDIKPDHASDATALALLGLSRRGYYKW